MTPRKAVKAKIGRPSSYREEYAAKTAKLCLRGATDLELAREFGVSEVTINAWKKAHPTFLKALKAGKDEADSNVAASLYKRALGTDRVPPDTTACIFWLKNRRPLEWRDKQSLEHSGPAGGPIEVRTAELRDKIADRLAGIASRLPVFATNGNGNGHG